MDNIVNGIDLVQCERIERMVERHGERFLERVFTETERSYASRNKNKIECLAGRFAAKEAVLKVMGTGWRGKISWQDIEVINDAAGKPLVHLTGELRKISERLGIYDVSVSVTHTGNFAIASAVAVRRDGSERI